MICLTFKLQTLFDAHFLVTIARQQQVAGDAAHGSSASANDNSIISLNSALVSLTERLKLKLDVVSYRSASPLPRNFVLSYVCFLHAYFRFFSPHVASAAAAAAARCSTLSCATRGASFVSAAAASPPLKTPLDSILSPSSGCVCPPPKHMPYMMSSLLLIPLPLQLYTLPCAAHSCR